MLFRNPNSITNQLHNIHVQMTHYIIKYRLLLFILDDKSTKLSMLDISRLCPKYIRYSFLDFLDALYLEITIIIIAIFTIYKHEESFSLSDFSDNKK